MPTNSESDNQYGPFSDALLGPLQGRPQQAPLHYAPSTAGALAMFASQFLQGAQGARRTAYERSEQKKQEHEHNFNRTYQAIQDDPTLSREAKTAAHKIWLNKTGSALEEHVTAAGKEHKDNPLLHLTKAIAGAMVGPDSNPNHKDLNVNDLLSIANDPKNKIDPQAEGAKLAQDTVGVLHGIRTGTPGQPAYTPSGPSSGQIAAAQPDFLKTALPPAKEDAATPSPVNGIAPAAPAQDTRVPVAAIPGTAPQDVNLQTIGQNDRMQALNARSMAVFGVPLDKNPYTADIVGSVPKFAPPKILKESFFPVTVDGQTQTHSRYLMQAGDGQTYWQDNGPAAAPPKMLAGTTLRAVQVKITPDAQPVAALQDPKNPQGFVDYYGKPLPSTAQVFTPDKMGSGLGATYRMAAIAQLHADGIASPTSDQIMDVAGTMIKEQMGSQLSLRQQQMVMNEVESGVGAGPGFQIPRPTTAPPKGTPSQGGGTTTAKPPANTQQTAGTGSAAAGAPAPSQADLDNMAVYYQSETGSAKATGKTNIRAQQGMRAMQKYTGLNPVELGAEIADHRSVQKSLETANAVLGAYTSLQNRISEHGQVLIAAAKQYGPDGTPLLNKTSQYFEENLKAHPELTQLKVAVAALKEEYGKLIAGGVQSRGMVPPGAAKEAEKFINPSATLEDMVAAVQQMQTQADTDHLAISKQVTELKGRLAASPLARVFGSRAAAPPTAAPPAARQGGTGTVMLAVNGETIDQQLTPEQAAMARENLVKAGKAVKLAIKAPDGSVHLFDTQAQANVFNTSLAQLAAQKAAKSK